MTPDEAITLKQWIESELRGRDREVLGTAKELDRRLREMDELRHRIEAERSEFLTKEEYERRHEELMRQISELSEWRANVTGRLMGLAVVGTLFVAAVTALATHLIG